MFFFTPHQAENFLPKAYNSFAGEFSETRQRKWAEFDELSEGTPHSGKILDVGCGNGRLRKFLEENKFSGEYFARDVASNFLDHAKKNLQDFDTKKLHFSQGGFLDLCDTHNTGFENNTFDEVWAIASFHHLSQDEDRKKALHSIQKILKPDGTFVLTVWNLWEQKKYIPQKKEAFWRSVYTPFFSARDFLIPWGKQKTPRYYYSFSQEYITKLLAEAGFEIQKIFYSEKKRNLCIRAKKHPHPAPLSGGEGIFVIQNIPFHITTEKKVLEKMQEISEKKNNTTEKITKIYTPNPEMIVESQKNQRFLEVLQRADISLADGNGILWASGLTNMEGKFGFWKNIQKFFSLLSYTFLRKNYPSKITQPICGSDIFQKFLENTKNSSQVKIFLLGGEKGSAEYIQQKYPQISGIFDKKVTPENFPEISQNILDSGANVVFVALGAPKQELLIDQLSQNPEISGQVSFAMGVGGSFDFVSGHQKRAPKIFRTLGIEWLFRLIKYPERRDRIWNATGKFIGLF